MTLSLYRIFLILSVILFSLSCQVPSGNSSSAVDVSEQWIISSGTRITYSKHARCRMDCRFIDEDEVREILIDGQVDPSRTRISHQGESRAYEGVTHDGQLVRIIASEKSDGHIHIVTVIDLGKDWNCDCQ